MAQGADKPYPPVLDLKLRTPSAHFYCGYCPSLAARTSCEHWPLGAGKPRGLSPQGRHRERLHR